MSMQYNNIIVLIYQGVIKIKREEKLLSSNDKKIIKKYSNIEIGLDEYSYSKTDYIIEENKNYR